MPGYFAKLIALIALLWLPQAHAAITIKATRVWPAQDYTRLTLESSKPIDYNMFTISNPERLVVDLKNVALHGALDSLAGKISKDDPYIKSVRVGQFKRHVVRLVLDLKAEVKPQLFSLKPVAQYGYRLVLDVYPAVSDDALMALAQQSEKKLSGDDNPPATSAASSAAANSASSFVESDSSKTETPSGRYSTIGRHTMIIAIDPGHGGEDPGAHGHHGTLEKNVTLAIARKLRVLVNDTEGMHAVMTRDGDYFIPLGVRVEKARKAHADLFVSIHADAYVNPRASGSSVFALSEHGATSAAARWLAKNENEADLVGGVNIAVKDPYLARTLLDLSQTATISDSLKLAKQVLHQLGDINNLHRGRVEQAGFAVLKAPDIPSILVETAFISNPAEERKLRSNRYQEKVAHAILDGIKRYIAQNPPVYRPTIAQND
jgi:N-acetylmuramoyl-L-alanine amidase